MKRNTLNFVVDALCLLAMFCLMVTGAVIRFILPPGTGGRHGDGPLKTLWGLGRHDWGDIHYCLAIGLAVFVLIHLILHWTWLCATAQRLIRGADTSARQAAPVSRHAYGIGLLLLVAAASVGLLWIASTSVTPGEHEDPAPDSQADGDQHEVVHQDRGAGWGAKTLADIESETGVSATLVKQQLGLPDNAPTDEPLGRLARQYGFRMSAVHDIIDRYQANAAPPPSGAMR